MENYCLDIIPLLLKLNFRLEGKGLGVGSEQALEASHSAFKKIWVRYSVKDHLSPVYLNNYLDAVIHYNWLHI